MTNEGTSAPAVSLPAENPLPVFSLKELGKPKSQWTLTIHPSHLALAETPGAQPFIFLRDQMMKSVVLMNSPRALVINQPRKITLQLTPEANKTLADWVGMSFLASFYLNRRYKIIFPWALIWIFGVAVSFLPRGHTSPLFLPPSSSIPGFILGVALLAACAFAKWRPHPILFLVDAFWFASMAINLTIGIGFGRSKWWFVLVAIFAFTAITGFKHYFFFRNTKMARGEA